MGSSSPTSSTPFLAGDTADMKGRTALETPSCDEKEELLPSSTSRTPKRRFRLLRNTNPQQQQQQPSSRKRRKRACLSTALQVATYTLAVWGIVSLFLLPQILTSHPDSNAPKYEYDVYRPSTLPQGLNLCDCGPTIPSALALGCVYDTLAAAWLPPHCRDSELTSLFDIAGPGPNGEWSYFLDAAGTIPLTKAELAALGGTETKFWVSRRWHVAHCLFYWQKMWRMRETGVVMEERFDGIDHIRHCSRLILKHVPEVEVGDQRSGGGGGGIFLLDVPVMMNASTEAAKRASRKGHH